MDQTLMESQFYFTQRLLGASGCLRQGQMQRQGEREREKTTGCGSEKPEVGKGQQMLLSGC